jgi:hypothetical protein
MDVFSSYIFLFFVDDTHIIHFDFVVFFIFELFVFQLASMGLVV